MLCFTCKFLGIYINIYLLGNVEFNEEPAQLFLSSGTELLNQNVHRMESLNTREKEESNDDIDVETNVSETSLIENVVENLSEQEELRPDSPREVYQLRKWALECNIRQTHFDKLLQILRVRLLPELPVSSKTFFETESMPYVIRDIEDNDGTLVGQYVYFGIANGLQKCVNPRLHQDRRIRLQISVDGLPIFSSSKMQFWPILGRVFASPDVYTPFLIAIYCGQTKPLSVNAYLQDFVTEINELGKNNIEINGINFTVHIQCFICDTPARSFIKLTKGHCGYSACERCTVRGIRKHRRMVYLDVDSPERTDNSFRNMEDEEHHIERSVLLTIVPPINMIISFVLDYMHLCCIGVMKRLVDNWLHGSLKNRLTPRNKRELSRRIEALRTQILCEFQRKLRNISHAAQFKATEYRFLLLYCGPIVLKNLLPKNLYKHFLLLHVACRILCTDELAQKYNTRAKLYLRRFVELLPYLYGTYITVLNMHNLIHLADDAANMNCSLSRISAFLFENFFRKFKNLVRILNQPL